MKRTTIPFWGWLALLLFVGTTTSAQSVSNTFAASTTHSASIHPDGTLWAWGSNFSGQLGDGTTTPHTLPTQVLLPSSGGSIDPINAHWAQVATGNAHTLALTIDGQLYAWGSNYDGQLGNGSTTGQLTPLKVELPADASDTHTLALTADGRLYACGDNSFGQLGTGTTVSGSSLTRVLLPTGTICTQLAAGSAHSLALTADGQLYAWGRNKHGQLGDGTLTLHSRPVAVALPRGQHSPWTKLAAGRSHSLALTADGQLYAWGSNEFGQLAESNVTYRTRPGRVALPAAARHSTWAQVTAGDAHSQALTADGRLYAWGSNLVGQLGDHSTARRLRPVAVALPHDLPSSWARVAAGGFHTLALSADGQLYTWGHNAYGQLGDGSTTQRISPAGNDQALLFLEFPTDQELDSSQLPENLHLEPLRFDPLQAIANSHNL
jgi:alpha-tubulin suppressor-like RCC1 family protein